MAKLIISAIVVLAIAGIKVWTWYRSDDYKAKKDRKAKDKAHAYVADKDGSSISRWLRHRRRR